MVNTDGDVVGVHIPRLDTVLGYVMQSRLAQRMRSTDYHDGARSHVEDLVSHASHQHPPPVREAS